MTSSKMPPGDVRRQRSGKRSFPDGSKAGSNRLRHISANRNMFANLVEDAKSLVDQGAASPIRSLAGLLAFASSLIALFGFFSSSSGGEGGYGYTSTPLLSNFPIRVMVFLLVATSIGWTISTFGIWITSRPSQWSRILSHFMTVLSSIFLAACIDWIFAPDIQSAPRIVLFFVTIGVAGSVFLAKTNYRYTLEPDLKVTRLRAELLLTFTASAVFLVFLREFTGL